MLASSHNNHHLTSPRHFPPSSSRNTQQHRFNLSQLSATPSPSESNKSSHYFDTNTTAAQSNPVILDTSSIPINNIDLFMPNSADFQQSNPSRGFSYGLPDDADLALWQLSGGNSGVANQISPMNRGQNHQRMPSSSSIGSSISQATASPFQGHQQVPRNVRVPDQVAVKQEGSRGYRTVPSRGHLPSPAPTPTRNNFISPTNSTFSQQDMNPAFAASLGLNQALNDDLPQMSHSNRPSFSSVAQGPATPMTTMDDDAKHRMMNNGENLPFDYLAWLFEGSSVKADSMNSALLNVTNSLPDLFYSQNLATAHAQSNPNFLMPHGGSVNERLLEAQMARSQSSGSNQSVPRSPMKYHTSPQSESEPKTISPKDAVLEYNPSSDDYPLFGQTSNAMTSSFGAVAPAPRQQFQHPSVMVSQGWQPSLLAMSASQPPAYNTFATPSLPSSMSMGSMNNFMGTSGNPRRTISRQQTDQIPEFPAQLTSMESSASEAAPPSSGNSSNMVMNMPKPDTAADTGTYSCTYHGCLQRFSTPQKLQKHKRDAHRNNPHITPGVGSGLSTAELMERNSQAGPHKCERINPTTGKACNSIFSRPYDLTRHENVIHNPRKQKVRCAICVEDKTFSREDALTRHMRVVHPEVDFPGKHSKRGSRVK